MENKIDMNRKEVYIYYSAATDVTGKKLCEALKVEGGSKKPTGKKMVIGWGAKTKEDTIFGKNIKVLNHPDYIRTNRNKFEAMKIMSNALNKDGKYHVAPYVLAGDVKASISSGNISLPLIGRTKYHQGGKGFWSCPTMAQLDDAISAGAHHFQSMLAIKDEYRLHVFGDKVIHAVKKVKRSDEEFEKAFIEDELARQKVLAEKNNNAFDEVTAKLMLKRQAKNATAGGANMLLRSNRLGWKFSIVKKYNNALKDIAIQAVKALGLDFGAVDCCMDTNGNAFVFEINTGPGLEATSFDKYVEAFNNVIGSKAVKGAKSSSAAVKSVALSERSIMQKQLADFQKMLEECDDAEFSRIKEIGTRLIFGGQE